MSHQITRKITTFFFVACLFAGIFLSAIECFATADSRLLGVREPELFSRSWDFKATPNLAVIPAVDSSSVYFVDSDNKLIAIDSITAARLWASELGGEVASNIILSDTSVLLATSSPATEGGPGSKTFLRSISRQTGVTEWRVEIGASSNVWIGLYSSFIATVGENGAVSALSRGDGKVIWSRDLVATVSTSPMFGQKEISLGTVNNEIVELAIVDGVARTIWKSEHLPTALATDSSGRLVVGDERGSVTAVSAGGERSWTFRNGARISSVLVGDSEYLASSNDNFIYRLTRSGNVKWKRRLPGRLAQAPLILDDVAVISVSGGGGIFVLDVNKGKVLDRIQSAEDLSFAIGGAPGNSKSFVVAGPSGVSFFSRENRSAK